MKRLLNRETFLKIILLSISIFLTLVLSEIIVRFTNPFPNHYFTWDSYLNVTFKPSPLIMPGIHGNSRFIVNSCGIRGTEIPTDKDVVKILAMGGSATECLYLDQFETWPYLLQEKLNEHGSKKKVWVGIVGKSGLTSRDHIIQMKYLLQEYQDIDVIILLVGVNDLLLRLSQDTDYNPLFMEKKDSEETLLPRAFNVFPVNRNKTLSFYKKTALWQLTKKPGIQKWKRNIHQFVKQDDTGQVYLTWREHRHNAKNMRLNLPDLTSGLEEYSHNIQTIINRAREKSVRLIIVSQPYMWRGNLPKYLEDLLWMGGVGNYQEESGKEYYSTQALDTGMKLYNSKLIQIAKSSNVEYVDLAGTIPQDTTAFYDDVHFNENGAKIVSDILVKKLGDSNIFKNRELNTQN